MIAIEATIYQRSLAVLLILEIMIYYCHQLTFDRENPKRIKDDTLIQRKR